jgi:hypothetical protein
MSIPTDDDRSRRARALFDAQVDALDGATATALRARRREALAAMPAGRRAAWWWPASGIATAALAMALWLPRSDVTPTDGSDVSTASTSDTTMTSTTAATPPAPLDGDPGPASADENAGAAPAAAARFADTALVELDNDADFYAWLATVPDDAGLDADATALPAEGLTL